MSIIIPGAGPGGRDLRRAYSIASSPDSDHVELCIKKVENGPGTSFLNQLKTGDQFTVFAPYGDFVYKTQPDRHVCFIATGTGLAPFRSMMESRHYQESAPLSETCLFGVATESEILYEKIFKNRPTLNWIPCISRSSEQWGGYKGRITEYVKSNEMPFPWLETEYYLCGNGEMIKQVREILSEKGVPKESIHQEKYY